MINTVKYADFTNSGSFSSIIGWLDFGPNFHLSNGQSKKVTNILPGGYIINFIISFSSNDASASLISFPPPIMNKAEPPLGNNSYLNVPGYIVLGLNSPTASSSLFTANIMISNINVINLHCNCCCKCTNYSLIAADAETTNNNEIWQAVTNGSSWMLINLLPSSSGSSSSGPTITGIGTDQVTETGVTGSSPSDVTSGVFLTQNAANLSFTLTTSASIGAVALGILPNAAPAPNYIISDYKNISVQPSQEICYKFNPAAISPANCSSAICYTNKCNDFCVRLLLDDFSIISPGSIPLQGNLGLYYFNTHSISLIPYENFQPGACDEFNFLLLCHCYSCYQKVIFLGIG